MEMETTQVMIHTTSSASNLLYNAEHEHNCMKGYPDQKQIRCFQSNLLSFWLQSTSY